MNRGRQSSKGPPQGSNRNLWRRIWYKTTRLRRFLLLLIVLAGIRPYCSPSDCGLCSDLDVYVAPGECVLIENPCNIDWDSTSTFGFMGEDGSGAGPVGFGVKSTDRSRNFAKYICAVANVAEDKWVDLTYTYTDSTCEGEGFISITTDCGSMPSLRTAVSATPTEINPGESTNLKAAPCGGTPPYSYQWSSNPWDVSLNSTNNEQATASPTVDTEYTVTVVDSANTTIDKTVSVIVNMNLDVSATPDTINNGEQSQLLATPSGGLQPYTFSWKPDDSLDDPTIENPIATPTTTTEYTVNVKDSRNTPASGTVTVTVNQPVPGGLMACFDVLTESYNNEEYIVLDAGCSSPWTDLSYRWELTLTVDYYTVCYGAGASVDWEPLSGTPNASLSSCSDDDFNPDLVRLPCGWMCNYEHQVKLIVKDSTGNTDFITVDYP